MSAKRRWNERTRLMLTLELAVVLPAAALVALFLAYHWASEILREKLSQVSI